ncbi:MAG: hypothetical protein CL406_06480 [Acidimicrobiaceae bacterium]|nr:hypothetical protein [Acidimicrobiaceae bacterium]MDP6480478.1 hypothetical protein [Acidimicrobiales bacterium]MDP6697458.1 hypothetical protein [Acidimicrobiales bacterium]
MTDTETVQNPGEVRLQSLEGTSRPVSEWLTTFHMAAVVLDPFTHESSWILDTARRVLDAFSGADVRVAFVVSGTDSAGAASFMGPLAESTLSLADPDRGFARSLGLMTLPAFVAIRQDGSTIGTAEGWDPEAWRKVAAALAELTAWTRPEIPAAGDPAPYAGTPAAS